MKLKFIIPHGGDTIYQDDEKNIIDNFSTWYCPKFK
jgi:hypothetical protein